MIGSMTIAVIQSPLNGVTCCTRHLDDALLNDGRQFTGWADEATDLNASLLAINDMNGEQRAAIDLMVKPHVGNPVEKQFRAYRRIKHSKHSENVGAA